MKFICLARVADEQCGVEYKDPGDFFNHVRRHTDRRDEAERHEIERRASLVGVTLRRR